MQRQNVPSSCVTPSVNSEIFGLLGEKSFTLATGFAEILSENEAHDDWLKLGVGVICYVRDYSHRNVTLRLFDTDGFIREIWSTLVAPEEIFTKDTSNFVVFERGDGMSFGINFVDAREAERFYSSVRELQSKRPRRSSSTHDRERNDTNACTPTADSSLTTPNNNGGRFLNELSSLFTRNRTSRAASATSAFSRISEMHDLSNVRSQVVKWEHEGTFHRFTMNYDDTCDAYQRLREDLNHIQQNFKGRLAWKDSDGDWIEFASDFELRHAIDEGNSGGIFYIRTIGDVPKTNSLSYAETRKSLLSSVSSTFSQAFQKPPPLDKKDIGKPTGFRHIIHVNSNGDILQGCSKDDLGYG